MYSRDIYDTEKQACNVYGKWKKTNTEANKANGEENKTNTEANKKNRETNKMNAEADKTNREAFVMTFFCLTYDKKRLFGKFYLVLA